MIDEQNYLKDVSAIIFYDVPYKFSSPTDEIKYEIRSRNSLLKTSSVTWKLNIDGTPSLDISAYSSDFLQLQYLINEAYLDLKAEDMGMEYERVSSIQMTLLPYPPHENNAMTILAGCFVSSFIVSCFVVTFPMIIKRLADEKVNGAREMFKMFGLNDWIYWGGNFIHHFSFLFVIGFVMICFMYFGGIFKHSNFLIIQIFMLVYVVQSVLLAFLVSILFNRPIVGIVVGVIIWNFSYLPGIVLSPIVAGTNDFGRLWSCLLSNSALSFGMQVILIQENQGQGSSFSNLYKPTMVLGELSLGSILGMMIASSFLTAFLIWYLDNVWPFQPGVPKPAWYLFTPDYWFKRIAGKNVNTEEVSYDPRYFEKREDNTPVAIRLKGVTKIYGQVKKKVAVDNVSLNIYRDEITCLLGQNGAGKTTTMSMITGMFPPTSGKIFINNMDLMKDTKEARRSMSLCPQHNPLYTELTVREHLFLYGAIKGYSYNLLPSEVEKVINEINLSGEEDKLSSLLSGGMKRKLCLGVALVGDTKIVVLDEPTSGLDTEVRRSIWDLLRNARRSRTILLSTHDMEEADALADRIVIMSEGQLSCAGTSMFLKSVFGAGYTLKIAKLEGFNEDTVSQAVRKYFPQAHIKSNVGSEISFSLESKDTQTDSSTLPSFFRELEEKKDIFFIESFGLSITTMEDVFLKVGEMSDELLGLQTQKDGNSPSASLVNGATSSSTDTLTLIPLSTDADAGEKLTAWALDFQIIKALFLKRFDFGKRYWPMLLFQILVPAFILFLSFQIINGIFQLSKQEKALDLDLVSIYGKDHQIIYQNNRKEDGSFGKFWKTILEKDGLTIREIEPNKNVSQELLEVDAKELPANKFIRKFLFGLSLDEAIFGSSNRYNLWINNEAYHAAPIALNQLYRTLEAELFDDVSFPETIHLSSQPLPSKYNNQPPGAIFTFILRVMWSFMLPLSIPFLAASYVLFPASERLSKAKLIQVMTGLSPLLLHVVNFLFDILQHLLAVCVLLVVITVFDSNRIYFHSPASSSSVFFLFMLMGVAVIPISYFFSFFTKKTSTAFSVLVIIFVVSGFLFSLLGNILRFLANGGFIGQSTTEAANWLFSISPIYTFSSAMGKIYEHGTQKHVCHQIPKEKLLKSCTDSFSDFYIQGCCPETCKNTALGDFCLIDNPIFWGDRGIGQEIVMTILITIIAWFALVISETSLFRGVFPITKTTFRPPPVIEEEDVLREKQRVNQIVVHGNYSTDALVVNDLVKQFKSFHAVKGVSFGVHHKECFGLLGVNGAGKTTTFGK
jgi:ATP-binding cassette subfamily A (ABC1) protein 3